MDGWIYKHSHLLKIFLMASVLHPKMHLITHHLILFVSCFFLCSIILLYFTLLLRYLLIYHYLTNLLEFLERNLA